MADRYFNVWIEIEEVEVIDGCDMFYEDHGGPGSGKVGRFGTLAEAEAFADSLSTLSGVLDAEVTL